MKDIKIEKFKAGDEVIVSLFVKRVYDEFVAPDYSDEGNQKFYEWIEPEKIAKRQKIQVNVLLAWIDSELAGMIEIRENNQISLLFVEKKQQGRGIARKLFREALQISLQREPSIDKYYVHASPFSIPVYKKLGFKETEEMQKQFGIKYLPMEMSI